ncbi:MAG TPA: peroxiredoxin [Abditibacteriaceae bacterium]
MLQENSALPAFALPSTVDSERTLTNAHFAGRAFVLFIYPKDATSGCTLEAQQFAALYPEFQKHGVEIVGLSRDALSAHRKFIAAQNLPFALLSDKEQTTLRAWDLIVNATMYGKPVTKVARTTIAVDAKGVVQRIWRNVTPAGHAQEVLDWVQLNF